MSTRQRIAHVTGLNLADVGRLPQPGASFSIPGGGAPGALGGPESGFSIAVSYHLAPKIGSSLWDAGPQGTPGDTTLPPLVEFLVSSVGANPADVARFQVTSGPGASGVGVSSGIMQPASPQEADVVLLISYVPDSSFYSSGWAAINSAQVMINGEFVTGPNGSDRNFAMDGVGDNFCIGGLSPNQDVSGLVNGDIGGCYNSAISGVWVTPGIPSIDQAVAFMDASMEAGVVVPRPFNPARTQAGVPTTAPDEPQGFYWNAADLPSELALGTPWVDRLSGLELQLLGSQLGAARVISRSPFYILDPDMND